MMIARHFYDSSTLNLLREVLERAWTNLSERQQNEVPRSQIAERLLNAAAEGERDPDRLYARALDGIVSERA